MAVCGWEDKREMNCPICMSELHYDSATDTEDINYQADGIVSHYHCTGCGAEIEILMPFENPYKEG